MEPSKRTTVVLPGKIHQRVAEIAEEYGLTESEVIRSCLRNHLDDLEDGLSRDREESEESVDEEEDDVDENDDAEDVDEDDEDEDLDEDDEDG